MAQDGLILTEAQVAALEKAKADKEAHGEFVSECPGYCGAQDTFYVGHAEGRRPHLPADLRRHLRQGRLRQALRPQDAAHRRRSAQRPGDSRSTRSTASRCSACSPTADRILRNPRPPRIRTLSGGRGHRPHPNQGQEPADQRHRRALPQDHARRVLPHRLPQEDLRDDRRPAGRPRPLDAEFNEVRPHQGKWCFGKTPMQTFLDARPSPRKNRWRTVHRSTGRMTTNGQPAVRQIK